MTYSTPPKEEAKWWLPIGLAFTAWANAVAATYSNDFGGDGGWGRGSVLEGLELQQNSGGSPAPPPGASPSAATPPPPSTPPGFIVAMDWSWRERTEQIWSGRAPSVGRSDSTRCTLKRHCQRVCYAMSRILGPTCQKRPQPSQMTCSVQSTKLLLNLRWLLQMISDHVVFCKISPKCGGFLQFTLDIDVVTCHPSRWVSRSSL